MIVDVEHDRMKLIKYYDSTADDRYDKHINRLRWDQHGYEHATGDW